MGRCGEEKYWLNFENLEEYTSYIFYLIFLINFFINDHLLGIYIILLMNYKGHTSFFVPIL